MKGDYLVIIPGDDAEYYEHDDLIIALHQAEFSRGLVIDVKTGDKLADFTEWRKSKC